MKKLLLVDVPDGYTIETKKIRVKKRTNTYHPYSYIDVEFKEIQLPTIEEIERNAAETTSDMKSWLASVNGANWLKSKLQ